MPIDAISEVRRLYGEVISSRVEETGVDPNIILNTDMRAFIEDLAVTLTRSETIYVTVDTTKALFDAIGAKITIRQQKARAGIRIIDTRNVIITLSGNSSGGFTLQARIDGYAKSHSTDDIDAIIRFFLVYHIDPNPQSIGVWSVYERMPRFDSRVVQLRQGVISEGIVTYNPYSVFAYLNDPEELNGMYKYRWMVALNNSNLREGPGRQFSTYEEAAYYEIARYEYYSIPHALRSYLPSFEELVKQYETLPLDREILPPRPEYQRLDKLLSIF